MDKYLISSRNGFTLYRFKTCTLCCVMAERLSTRDSNSGVSDLQSVGSSSDLNTCVLKQDANPLLVRPVDGLQTSTLLSL